MQTMPMPNSINRQLAHWLPLLAVLNLLVFSLIIEAAKPAQPNITPLCATLYNRPGDNLQSDNGSPDDGTSAIYCEAGILGGSQAHFDSYGRFVFSTGNPATSGRVAFIDVTDCLSNCGSLVPLAGDYQMNLYTTAPTCNGPVVDLRTLPLGASANVGMVIRILVPFLPMPDWKQQTEWLVVFGDWPDDPECDALHVKYPCSNGAQATVTRSGNTWTLEAPATEVCLLEAVKGNGGKTTLTQRGRISFPFKITMTLP